MSAVSEAEEAAIQLLESWWTTPAQDAPLPVDPTQLAKSLGIEVREVQLPLDESGNITIPSHGSATISLNWWDHPNRQRFTCAHEIGHYVRRSGQRTRGLTFTDRRDTLAGLGVDVDEVYANQFAAALLMPAHLVYEGSKSGMNITNLAQRFGTSTQAMNVRLRNLRLA